jgi:hypothetical protein
VKKEEAAPHGQGSNKTVNRTANRKSLFSQLPIDIGGFDVVRELEVNAGKEAEKSRRLTILSIVPNAVKNLLNNNTTRSNVLSLLKALFQNLSFTRGLATQEVNPH